MKTPTPTQENSNIISDCCENLTKLTEEDVNGFHGVFFGQSNGSICFDSLNYVPTGSVPTIVYIFKGPTDDPNNYCGRIILNDREGGITLQNFNSTIFTYIDSDGICYESDLATLEQKNNMIIFNKKL